MQKKIFRLILALIFCIFLIPFFTAAGCKNKANNMGWNINKLEKQLKNKETFVFYYGTDRCEFCQSAKKILTTNSNIKNAIKNYKNNAKVEFLIYWYSTVNDPKKAARREFDQKLKQLFQKMDIKNGDALVESGVPLILFFKQGKLITEKNVWSGKDFEAKFIKNLKKLSI